MASTRSNESHSSSSSSEDTSPPSPKRQKAKIGSSPGKSLPPPGNLKKLSTPAGECSSPAVGDDAESPVPVKTPFEVACDGRAYDGIRPSLAEAFNRMGGLVKFKASGSRSAAPWCRFLPMIAGKPTIYAYMPTFAIGCRKGCNTLFGDVSEILCKIKHGQIFQQLNNGVVVRGAEVQSGVGKSMQLGRRSRNSSAAADVRGDKEADIGANDKNSTVDCDPNACTKEGNVSEEINEAWAMQTASTSGISGRFVVLKENVRAAILDEKEIDVSFDSFPYYLSENTKNVLVAACFMHLKYHKEHEKYFAGLTTINPRILLSGPAGSEIYQEMLVKALAKYFGAKLLIFDSHLLLLGLPSKEDELLKDGFYTKKSCSFAKKSPTDTEMASNMDQSSTETKTSSDAPTLVGLESQHKLENDNTTGTAKNCLFKLGDRVKFSCSNSRRPSSDRFLAQSRCQYNPMVIIAAIM